MVERFCRIRCGGCGRITRGSECLSARHAVSLLLLLSLALGAGEAEDLLKQAGEAVRTGRTEEALTLATRATTNYPTNSDAWFLRGVLHERLGKHTNAVADYDQAVKFKPASAIIFQHRGVEHFRLGNFEKSVADFDRFLKLSPEQAAHHWQRGISCYYAGQFEEGRKQFELHQTVNPHDVENTVWHFLCVTRSSGLEKARASLIPIEGDARVPMKEIHALFAGKGTVEGVLDTARSGRGEEPLFYAHLYLGLYFEALGDREKAREHIFKAAREFKAEHYMGDVARVHARVLEKQKP
jgi:lipoprotein NlpI